MAISDILSRSIFQNLQEELEYSTFHDVIISVQNTEFKGHKFILSANSKYFKNIFTSESDRNSSAPIILKNITPETFRLVLDCIYGGKDVLTAANLAEIWHAAVYLEIDFLYQACELHQTSRLTKENCVEMTNQATTFKSKKLKEAAWNMIVKEFKDIASREDVVLLDAEDLLQILNSEDLAIDCEDYVVNAIVRWIQHSTEVSDCKSYDDNSQMDYKSREKEMQKENCNISLKKRKNYLVDMLKSSRLCLVSGSCLQSLLNVKVIAENKQCLSVICKALLYQLQPDWRGYHCPPQAIHRANSKLENVIISFNYPNQTCYMSCRTLDGTWYGLATQGHILASPVLYGQRIYSTGPANNQSLFTYCTVQKQWKSFPGFATLGAHVLIGLDRYLYAISSSIYRIAMMEYTCVWENVGHLMIPVTDLTLTTFGTNIVIFGNDTSSRLFKVQLFDTLTSTCTVYTDQLPDQIKNSKPFHVYNSSYVLHSSGEVFKLTPCDKNKVQFENKGKLFERPINFSAVVTFNDHLIIAVSEIDPQMTRKWETQIIDGVKTVEIIERQSTLLLNAAIPKSLLVSKET